MQRNTYCFIILFILSLSFFPKPSDAQTVFERKFSLGGQHAGGNTRLNSLHFDYFLSRSRKHTDEVAVKGNFDYESSDNVDTVLKAYSSLRCAYSITRQFYHFYKLEMEHDRFQDIDLRTIPSVGLGFWFRDDDAVRFTIEGAIGYQRNYLLNRMEDEIVVLKVSPFLRIGGFSNDFDIFVDAADFNNFRFVNEMVFKIKLNTHYSLKWMLKDEYNNRPAAGVQKNDVRTTLGIEYAFKSQ